MNKPNRCQGLMFLLCIGLVTSVLFLYKAKTKLNRVIALNGKEVSTENTEEIGATIKVTFIFKEGVSTK